MVGGTSGTGVVTIGALLGMAWQSGRLPLTRASLEKAIELNGTAVAKNLEALRIGCHLASDSGLAEHLLAGQQRPKAPQSLAELIEDRSRRLEAYWNAAYALKYRALLKQAECALPEELATTLHRVMAYKDEYEVARLLVADSFRKSIASEFGAGVRLTYHLAPPTLGTGKDVRKRAFGSWVRWPMAVLARMQWLRETPLDPFGRNGERQRERAWRDRYVALVETLASSPGVCDLAVAAQIARIPADVRGFGHVKMQAMGAASKRWDELSANLLKPARSDKP